MDVEEKPVAYWAKTEASLIKARDNLNFSTKVEPLVKTKLLRAKKQLTIAQDSFHNLNVTKLGRHSVRSEIRFVMNNVLGILEGLKDKAISKSRINELLPNLVSKLDGVIGEVKLKAQDESLNLKYAEEKKKKTAQLAQLEATLLEKVHPAMDSSTKKEIVTEAVKLHGLREGMQEILKEMQAEQKLIKQNRKERAEKFKKERDAEKEASFAEIEKQKKLRKIMQQKNEESQHINVPVDMPTDNRDLNVLEELMKKMKPEKSRLQKELNKADFSETDFLMMRGPIAIQTDPQIQLQKLEASTIKYEAIPYGGIKYGANPGGRREFIPHLFVFMDQLLIAIPNDSVIATGSSKPKKSAKSLKTNKKRASKADNSVLTREDIVAIINSRLNRDYIDVLASSTEKDKKWIFNKAFPSVRFMWLLRKSIYAKVGPFSIVSTNLPF